MKGLFILLLLFTVQISFSQNIKGIEISEERKEKLLSVIKTPLFVEESLMTIEEYNDFYIPIYLNNDTLVDFIFIGPSGAESNTVNIFLNKGQNFHLIKSELGNIKKIEKSFPDSPVEFLFNQYGCCDDPINYFQIWTMNNERIEESEKYYFLEKTMIPENFGFQFAIKVKNTPYYLRATPEIINENFSDYYEKGNIISEFSEGDIGFVLDSTSDRTGRVWYFVAMKKPQEKRFHNYSIYWDQNWLGWISGRFVEIIN